jgi:dihydrofolate synthase/folylpolyglutamate synthase
VNFQQSIEYLYGLGHEVLAMKLGLDNIRKLLAALGNPEKKYLKVQIAGTNGKGSTCAFLESICLRAGIKTGLTTSPHLVSITERARAGGRNISETDFARHASLIRKTSEELVRCGELETVPTFFEQVTAVALNYFAEAGVELAILETGLGGRFDAATAARAEIVAITPVDFDHQNILGESLKEIAAEKAAIIRPDAKVILAPQKKEAEQTILEKCREAGARPVRATENILVKKQTAENGLDYLTATFTTGKSLYPNVAFGPEGMSGRHQIINASTAIAAAETLSELGFRITEESVIKGLENARHKGRLEFYKNILFDGAHNAAGAKALRAYLDEFIKRPVTLVFGAMRDKELSGIASILFPKAEHIVFTRPDNPRSMETAELVKFLPAGFERKNAFEARSVKEALETADRLSTNGLICVTGSLYLIGEAQKILSEKV